MIFLSTWSNRLIKAGLSIPNPGQKSLGERIELSEFTAFFQNFKGLAIALSGIFTITAIIFFVISLAKLSASAGNDQARNKASKGVFYSGIALTLFGGATVLVGVFWNFLR